MTGQRKVEEAEEVLSSAMLVFANLESQEWIREISYLKAGTNMILYW